MRTYFWVTIWYKYHDGPDLLYDDGGVEEGDGDVGQDLHQHQLQPQVVDLDVVWILRGKIFIIVYSFTWGLFTDFVLPFNQSSSP